ncbi:hypothetical protein CDD81_6535 [Ophiocordyceps australis]|uniref:Lariat debranching enzyme C-terminal domain-containing protein n=1 Tax=Ophiocordyceps australis TaxID=1399860 RepID=A0A2C5XLY5_9HYPO|nr:hypothetical protein CDD81_6535 [Ophiocordyceps australis]
MAGVRLAIEGCGHGTLDAIYASVAQSCKARGWPSVDALIIGGDFQAVRNTLDLNVMSVPQKYRQLGDFYAYYSGARRSPYLTIFIGGNHEASSHLVELYYGGWVAPNIYYLGAANVLRLGPIRIAALSGICKGNDYHKPHHERLPFSYRDVKSAYHVRELDVRKLLQIRSQVDIGLSHDWPRGIEKHGDMNQLFKNKPFFKSESRDGTLGSAAAEMIMNRLRPPYWFSAHLHTKFAAIKSYDDAGASGDAAESAAPAENLANPDEIDLDSNDGQGQSQGEEHATHDDAAKSQAGLDDEFQGETSGVETNHVAEELRAQLPASFARPTTAEASTTPGQPVPPEIVNKQVRFLALDKCLPKRQFLQLCEVVPFDSEELSRYPPGNGTSRYSLEYDPEWLSIVRTFHQDLVIGDPGARVPQDAGQEHYRPLIDAERAWVQENIVAKDKLRVPLNFERTAPPHDAQSAQSVSVSEQPYEYTNPQTAAFCELVGLENLWDASQEEREARRRMPVHLTEPWGGGGGGGGRGRGGGGRGGGRRGDGGRGRGRGGRGGRGRGG